MADLPLNTDEYGASVPGALPVFADPAQVVYPQRSLVQVLGVDDAGNLGLAAAPGSTVLFASGPTGPIYGPPSNATFFDMINPVVLPAGMIQPGDILELDFLAGFTSAAAGKGILVTINGTVITQTFPTAAVLSISTKQLFVVGPNAKSLHCVSNVMNDVSSPGAGQGSNFVARSAAPFTTAIDLTGALTIRLQTKPTNGDICTLIYCALTKKTGPSILLPTITVNAWGDSLTAGTGATTPTGGWPSQLRNASAGRPVNNLGVGGQTATQIVDRMLADRTNGRNRIIVSWIGRNDVGVAADLTATVMAQHARAVANLAAGAIYLPCTILAASTEPTGHPNNIAILATNAAIRAAYPNAIDMFAALATNGDGTVPLANRFDTIHLNDAGYAIAKDMVIAKLMALGLVDISRTIDVAGAELVANGFFTTDISSWTDASSAGGVIAHASGVLRTTNISGTARARQTVTVETGARYACFMQNIAGTVNGSISVGSTTPGSNDFLNVATNFAIAARAGVKEFVATTTSAHIQLSTGVAGSNDWDNVTLRKLTPTAFLVGKVFSDDFSVKPDGVLGITPDGLAWRHMAPQNGSQVYPMISAGKMVAASSGASTTASYPYLHLGTGKATGVHCNLAWTGTGAGMAMISMAPTGTLPTVADIVANSLHVVFTDTRVDIGGYVGGVSTVETVNYAAPCATDGTVYTDVGWFLDGNVLTVKLPDGSTIQRTNASFAAVSGPVAIPEHYYGSGVTGTVAISKVAVRLG